MSLPIIQILNQDGIDVTEIITPFLGPNNDFNKTNYSPSFFGFEKLKFELLNRDIKEFRMHKNDNSINILIFKD